MSPIPVLGKHWARKGNKSGWPQRASLNQISKAPFPIFWLTGLLFRVPGLLQHWGTCHTHSSSSLFSNLYPPHHGDLSPIILSCHWDHSRISRSVPGLNGIPPYREYPEIWLPTHWPLLPFPPSSPFLKETEPSELLAVGAVDRHDHQEFSLDYLRMQEPRWWHR